MLSLNTNSDATAAFCGRLALETIPSLLVPLDGYSASDSGGETIVNGKTTFHGWTEIFQNAVTTAVSGAAVALMIWRIAYRPHNV